MPKGDWFSHLALGLIAGLGLALVYMTSLAFMNGYLVADNPYGPPERHQGNLNKGQRDHGYVEPFGQTTGDDIRKLEARENPDDPKYYQEQDRRAQKSAADASQVMVFLTEVSIMLGLVGAGAIIWTLAVSRESNSISRETAERQLRAYVLPANCTLELAADNDPTAHVRIQNFGQTPAFDVRSWIHIWVEAYPKRVEFPNAPDDLPKGQGVRGPGFHATFRHRRELPIHAWEMERIRTKTAAIYVYGVVEYRDCFGKKRRTKFLKFFYGEYDSTKTDNMHDYMEGNEAD
ncbi:hypothetical protein [Mesorhizobium opportunistum]|uniref:Transmembrane protein n=1 Tax=Mesorhizobium opportunistum (strain LMG 24607 / HAMBI 3007 / WSM2075) TaxID=536019 RepID=F7YG04_MESOW|nr:hypothetical protein [Mesorhizobium opportunistum]AEH88035.1 hypothetical protein Mesop_3593 [Mesorhizobium opportunistum WSM2075]